MFLTGAASRAAAVAAPLPGDDLVPDPQVVMNRAGSVPARAADVWPWLIQLGKARAGWYLPAWIERFVPRDRRAARAIEQRWQTLSVGDRVPDYGVGEAEFEVAVCDPPATLVYTTVRRTRRGAVTASWALVLRDLPDGTGVLLLRLRLTGLRHPRLTGAVGGWFDALTTAAMIAGLRERVGRAGGDGRPGRANRQA